MIRKKRKIPNGKLKGLRAERGLSQVEMAKILGVSEGTYVAKENGLRDFSITEAGILRKFFKISSDEIFFS